MRQQAVKALRMLLVYSDAVWLTPSFCKSSTELLPPKRKCCWSVKRVLAKSFTLVSFTNAVRSRARSVALNCGAMPDHLFENELFGHSAGAYTDAKTRSDGLVRAAEGGTLFLDEVHRLSLCSQVKLLRLLQEREYRRLGETRLSLADFRLISAMNSDPQIEMHAGRLREDLYYRLYVVAKRIVPLRDRTDDVDLLLNAFCERYSSDYNRSFPLRFHEAARVELRLYPWPGIFGS